MQRSPLIRQCRGVQLNQILIARINNIEEDNVIFAVLCYVRDGLTTGYKYLVDAVRTHLKSSHRNSGFRNVSRSFG